MSYYFDKNTNVDSKEVCKINTKENTCQSQ